MVQRISSVIAENRFAASGEGVSEFLPQSAEWREAGLPQVQVGQEEGAVVRDGTIQYQAEQEVEYGVCEGHREVSLQGRAARQGEDGSHSEDPKTREYPAGMRDAGGGEGSGST